MLTRRSALKSVAVIGSVAAFAGMLTVVRASAQTPPLRRSLGEIDLDDPILITYREFVTMMKARPAGDPVSWSSFSSIHGTDAAGFNLCPHGNWYFLPWHRAYLQMYEVACRTLTGHQEFALPYWDWTADRQLPRAFTDELWEGQPNPLFVPGRAMNQTDSLPDDMVGQTQVIDPLLDESNFEIFGTSRPNGQNNLDQSWITGGGGVSGPLEFNPHNRIHCRVGGVMCSGASPQDPVFMMHHGNIDRLWAVWNANGKANTTDPLWLDMPFESNFIAPDGANYTKTVRDLLEVEPLGYTYGLARAQPMPPMTDRDQNILALYGISGTSAAGFLRRAAEAGRPAEALRPLDVKLPISAATLEEVVGLKARTAATARGRPLDVVSIIRDVETPKSDTTEYRVFVNCDYLSQEVPTSDPHYVTTFGFFGRHDHADPRRTSSFIVNLTDTLRRLERGKLLRGDDLVVQILPVPRPGVPLDKTAPVTPAQIEVAVI